MTTLRTAAQQALEALEMSRRFVYADNRPQCDEAITTLRAALAQQEEPCSNCASLEAQNTELDRKLAELEQAHGIIESEIKVDSRQTLDQGGCMTRNDIIRMAREAGFAGGGCEALFRFAALVAAAEREACAKVCYDKANETFSGQCQVWGDYFARAIRARSNT